MSQNVVQWLNEVKVLQQQVQQAQAAEAAAHASTDHWRALYEKEARQRLTEAKLMQQTIDQLRAEIEMLKSLPQGSVGAAISQVAIDQAAYQLQTPEDLRAKLIEVWADRDRLAKDLKTEKANHAETRKTLTMALGDTVDMLTKLKTEGLASDLDDEAE